jgi:hypothetical protein
MVRGGNVTVGVSFHPAPATFLGLPAAEAYAVVVSAAIVAVVAGTAAWRWLARRGVPPAPPPPTPPAAGP